MGVSLDRFISATITRATRTVTRRGFGTVLIAAYITGWLDRVREYEDVDELLSDLVAAGYSEAAAAKHPAYLAAVALVSQSPRVERFKVGRRAGAPTQLVRLTPTSVEEGWEYSVTIGGETATYVVAAGDVLADVCTGIAAAINALTGAFTADGASGTAVDVTADTAGAWVNLTALDERLDVEDRTAEPATTLATDLAAIQAADADWYGLIIADAQSSAQIQAAATWAETQVIFYCAHSMDSAVADDVDTDVASVLKAASRLRTKVFYSRTSHGAFPDAALLGAIFPLTVGSADYEFKTLSGVVADDLSSTEVTRIIGTNTSPTSGKNATVYIEAIPTGTNSGTSITAGGLVAGGEWADVVTGLDFVRALLQESAFNVRISNPKVPFTEGGISSFEGTVENTLRIVAAPPYNILDPASITVQATKLTEVSTADRQARYYDGVRFDSRVQGAIRAVNFRGTVRP